MFRIHVLGSTCFSFQAVDSLVRATDASVAGKAATRLPSVNSSTADDLIPKVTYPLDQCSRANSQVLERVSERPTAACSDELADEIVTDGYDDFGRVRDFNFDVPFFTDHGEVGARTVP